MKKGRSHRDLDSIPWLAIVAGIVIIIIIAVLVMSWLGGGGSQSSTSNQPLKPGTSTTFSAQNTPQLNPEPTPISVPLKGVYVTVEYLGGFSGTYGINSNLYKVQSSQNHMYELVNATGTVYASFKKDDSTSKHALTVKIYKNGAVLNGSTTYTPFGKVDISAKV